MMFGGKCAYCGHELNPRWQADHVEPVNREHKWVRQPDGSSKAVATGKMWNPENDHEGNLVPACSACNNDKFNLTLEQWRRRLADLPGVCARNHSAYRHAIRFGLVVETNRVVEFHFEKVARASDEIIPCALCQKPIWFRDSWSPGDEAICAECDTEVTGRQHPPSLNPAVGLPPPAKA